MSGNITVEVIRGLKTMITPLGGNDTLPKRQTLTDWWKQVRFALEAVDGTVVVEELDRDVLERIGRILLGGAAWVRISRQPFISWATFVSCVERRFGGSEAHQRELFLQLTRRAGEDGLDFVQRVEDTRCRLGVSEEAALMRAWGQLPASITRKLEDHHDMNSLGPVEWRHLVNYTTRQLTKRDAEPSAALASATAVAPAPSAAPAARVAAAARGNPAPRAPYIRPTLPPPPPTKAKQAHVAGQHAAMK